MKKEFACIGDGTYILSESENPNIFYFYREDGGLLEDVGDIPMEMHAFYIQHKMFNGELSDFVAENIEFQESDDGKTIRLQVSSLKKQPNGFKQFIKRMFEKR